MFSFFTKKTFVADSFENMVDIHCHILPGIDDGAATTDVSRLMLEKYQSPWLHQNNCHPACDGRLLSA